MTLQNLGQFCQLNSKKDAPPWNQKCTEIVKELKQILKTLSSLKIPPNDKRILHTDASDFY